MNTKSVIAMAVVAFVVALGAIYFIDIDQTQEARLPEVNVEVSGGQAPAFDVKTGSVSIGEKETEVTVPNVEVTMEEKTVTVPTLEVTPAPAD